MKKEKTTNFMKVIIILGIVILPLIYSIIYLNGFWDPYGNLEGVPVALVNEDECEKECKGEALIDKLIDNGTFDFEVVSKEEAEEGLIDKTYYAVITIPSDFTDSFDKASTKERHEATITYSPNKKTSYLASQIINNAMTKVETQLHEEVTKQVVDNLSDKLKSVPEQTKQIESALVTIGNGTSKLDSGASSLKAGTSTLNTSYKAFDGGINELTSGINSLSSNYKTLNDGINTLYDSVHNTLIPQVSQSMSSLSSGVSTLKSGSDNLNSSFSTYKSSVDEFMTTTNDVYTALSQMCSAGTLDNEKLCQAAIGYTTKDETGMSGIDKLKYSTSQISGGISSLSNGVNTLNSSLSGVSSLTSGLQTLDDSILKLKNGSSAVYSGIEKIKSGASTLSSSSSQISSGINTLDSSVSTLKSGTSELNSGVSTATNAVASKISETEDSLKDLDGLSEYTAKPIKIKEKDYGKVDKYGQFFAPYFMSLSLWMGGILILIGLYYDPDNRFKILGRNSERRGLRLVIYNVIGVIQAIILGFVLKASTGFAVTNIWLYYGSCILISVSFLSIVMFLFFNFKDVGKFIAIVLLVLQLAASGGTFPIETEPAFYQAVFPFMPMKYSIELLRESLVNMDSTIITRDCLVLFGILIVFGGLTLLTGYLKGKKEKLQKSNIKKVKAK